MNRVERKIIIGGLSLVALALLVPPWKSIVDVKDRLHYEDNLGHRLIFSPPSIEPGTAAAFSVVKIDGQRLGVIVLAVIVVSGLAVFISRTRAA